MSRKTIYLSIILVFYVLQQNVLAAYSSKVASNDTLSIKNKILSHSSTRITRSVKWDQMITNIPSDYYHFFRESFQGKMIPTYVGIAALTGSFMAVDQKGWSFQRHLYLRSTIDNRTSNFMVNFGNGTYQFLSAAAFEIPGLIFHDETAIRTGSNIAEAILTTGIFVQFLKRLTGRQSPIASTENGGEWSLGPSIRQYQKNQPKYYSFPSGHLSTATAVITVIANDYPNLKWIRPVSYPILALLGFSLVNKGMHWYSDLPLAYFLGYTFGNIAAPPKSDSHDLASKSEKPKLYIFPSVGLNNVQFNLSFSF